MTSRKALIAALLAMPLGFSGSVSRAEVKPHALIGDNMVLQQGMKVPIWGTADESEQVTVHFQDQEVTATTRDGRWLVRLENLKAGGPFEMTIRGSNTIQFKNVLVGEIWICSGQSNMEWPLHLTRDADKTMESSANPAIRLFTVAKRPAAVPLANVQGAWVECGPKTVGGFTAVGYFFGRDLQKALKVPVGLIHTSWGGTPAEAWTSRQALEAEPALKHLAEKQDRELHEYPQALGRFAEEFSRYRETVARAAAAGQDLPSPPALPADPARNPWGAATLYNGMIAPLVPYAIRGATWYQGESNAGRAYEYRTLLPAMIRSWRSAWKQGDFAFLIVQLAPFTKIVKEPTESDWAELREAQLLTAQTMPNTGLAVITDVGEEFDIHPRNKKPVGARLALAARAIAYGQKVLYSGPSYSGMRVDGNKIILSFKHVGSGLMAKDGPLTGFTLAGADHKFVQADAEIQGDKVIVSSPQVAQPVAVRFGWANYPVVNLWNKNSAGKPLLPASPFRTDDFPMTTGPKHQTTAAK
jgi:sialate O-acetylesterase